jgi:hypothetical protein
MSHSWALSLHFSGLTCAADAYTEANNNVLKKVYRLCMTSLGVTIYFNIAIRHMETCIRNFYSNSAKALIMATNPILTGEDVYHAALFGYCVCFHDAMYPVNAYTVTNKQ